MEKPLRSFAFVLPTLNLLLWLVVVVAPAVLFYSRLKHEAHGAKTVTIQTGDFVVTLQSNEFRSVAIQGAALRAEKPVMLLNAPAVFVEVLISLIVSRTPNWHPASITWTTWRTVIYPIYAVPIWFYLGRGVDALWGRSIVRRREALISLLLAAIFTTLACGFRFGLTPAERQDQDILQLFIEGFALWAALFMVPFLAWIRHGRKPVVS